MKELSIKEQIEINGGTDKDYELGYAIGSHIRQGIETIISWFK
ncbi:hypothetical protein ABHQ57_08330 [Tenacibaculum sp. ZH5_bin.1]|nr:hypothetical protein [Tenacibaculum mesophilum]